MNGKEDVTRGREEVSSIQSQPKEIEVAVVGAGSVGLTMATILATYGVRTAVFDQAARPARHSQPAVIYARTLETLEPLGIVDEMLPRGVRGLAFWRARLANLKIEHCGAIDHLAPEDQPEAIALWADWHRQR